MARLIKYTATLLCAALLCVALPRPVFAAPAISFAQTLVRVPSADGTSVEENDSAAVDYSNAAQGYIMVKYKGGNPKVKLQITGSSGITYTYNLYGGYETFPLTSGSGTYKVEVYENVTGSSYANAMSTSISAQIQDSTLPYRYPNQYVNYSANSTSVAKGKELAASAADDLTVVSNVYNYVIKNVAYDTAKANTISAGGLTGYLPDPDVTLSTGKGICFDYAALMATMLRTQNIPTRLEVGYVSGGAYHAWVSVYIAEKGWVNGIIQFDGTTWKLMDPTFASSGNSSDSIMQYIGNGSNYSTKYVY